MMQKKSQKISLERQRAQEDLVGATLEYIQGMNIVKSFNLGGNSNQKMKQAIEESRVRNTKLETVFIPYGAAQQFVLRLISVSIMFCSILFYLQGSMTLVYCLLMCVASFLIFSELEKAGGKFDNFNSKQQKAIHELIDGLTEIPTKPNKDQYRVDNQSQYTKIVGRTYYNGEYALYAIQKGKTMYASIACPAIGPDISIDNIKEGFKLSLKEGKRAVWTKVK